MLDGIKRILRISKPDDAPSQEYVQKLVMDFKFRYDKWIEDHSDIEATPEIEKSFRVLMDELFEIMNVSRKNPETMSGVFIQFKFDGKSPKHPCFLLMNNNHTDCVMTGFMKKLAESDSFDVQLIPPNSPKFNVNKAQTDYIR